MSSFSTPASTIARRHKVARYDGEPHRRIQGASSGIVGGLEDNGVPLPSGHDGNASTSSIKYLHKDELFNGDLNIENHVCANHIKSLLTPSEVARPDLAILMNEKLNFIRLMRADVRDFAREKIRHIMVTEASNKRMKVRLSINGPVIDVVSFDMLRKSWMHDSSEKNQQCIFYVTYGWFDKNPQWNVDLESDYMKMRNVVYLDASTAQKSCPKKNCIAKHIADMKNNLVKTIRKTGMRWHGVSIRVTRPSYTITPETKYKKREKGFEYHIVCQNVQQLTSASAAPGSTTNHQGYDDNTSTNSSDDSDYRYEESSDPQEASNRSSDSFYQDSSPDEEESSVDSVGNVPSQANYPPSPEVLIVAPPIGGRLDVADNTCGINTLTTCDADADNAVAESDTTTAVPVLPSSTLTMSKTRKPTKPTATMKSPAYLCWHDGSEFNHWDFLNLNSEDQAAYCGVSKKTGEGYYLHNQKCALCSTRFVPTLSAAHKGDGSEFRPSQKTPVWYCALMMKSKASERCKFALCHGCFVNYC